MSDTTTHEESHVLYPPGISLEQVTANAQHHEFNAVVAGPGPFGGEPGSVDQLHVISNDNVSLDIFHSVSGGESSFPVFETPSPNTDAPLI